MCGFSYEPLFGTLDFDGYPSENGMYIKNVGDECMFLNIYPGRMLIRPGEQLKCCEKNVLKTKTRIPLCYG